MTPYSEWKKVLRTARFKGFEIMGTDDFDVFQELCKTVEERLVEDPMTGILLKIAQSYGDGKGFYINHEIFNYDDVIEGLKNNTYIGELYRKQAYPIIRKILEDHYDDIKASLMEELPMINKRSRNANAFIEEYETKRGNVVKQKSKTSLKSSSGKRKVVLSTDDNDNDHSFIDDVYNLENEAGNRDYNYDTSELDEEDLVILKANDFNSQ